jgi:hypothetical protein
LQLCSESVLKLWEIPDAEIADQAGENVFEYFD